MKETTLTGERAEAALRTRERTWADILEGGDKHEGRLDKKGSKGTAQNPVFLGSRLCGVPLIG